MVLFTTMMKLQIRIYPFESTMIFTHCYIWSKNCCNLLIVTVFFSAFLACCREKAKTSFSSSWITVRMSSYCLKAISEFLSSLIFWVKVLLTFWMLVIDSSIVVSLDSYTDHGNTYSLLMALLLPRGFSRSEYSNQQSSSGQCKISFDRVLVREKLFLKNYKSYIKSDQ